MATLSSQDYLLSAVWPVYPWFFMALFISLLRIEWGYGAGWVPKWQLCFDSIILNDKNLKAFPLGLGTRQRCPSSLLLFNIVLENLSRANRQEKEIKGIQIGKEIVKLSILEDDHNEIYWALKNPSKKYLETINYYNRVNGYRVSTLNWLYFFTQIIRG